ncbi:DUF4124 domain-containing protein [Massilia cavernae]|nr:DUF4124 domain-containing protein [Massilia cavernae]
MNSRAVSHTIIIAGLVFASSTFAGTDIVRCTDDEGHVTLTDRQCDSGAEEVLLSSSPAPAAVPAEPLSAAARSAPDGYQIKALPPAPRMRASTYAKLQPPGRALARDVLTMQQARRTLMLLDSNMPVRAVVARR